MANIFKSVQIMTKKGQQKKNQPRMIGRGALNFLPNRKLLDDVLIVTFCRKISAMLAV